MDEASLREAPTRDACPERTLVLGWNRRAPSIIRELDEYVAEGSEIASWPSAPASRARSPGSSRG